MTTPKKPTIITNPSLKTYDKRPVPFQFPGTEEKMYIGSEVSKLSVIQHCFVLSYFVKSSVSQRTKKKKKEKEESLPSYFSIECVCLRMFLFLFCSSFFLR